MIDSYGWINGQKRYLKHKSKPNSVVLSHNLFKTNAPSNYAKNHNENNAV